MLWGKEPFGRERLPRVQCMCHRVGWPGDSIQLNPRSFQKSNEISNFGWAYWLVKTSDFKTNSVLLYFDLTVVELFAPEYSFSCCISVWPQACWAVVFRFSVRGESMLYGAYTFFYNLATLRKEMNKLRTHKLGMNFACLFRTKVVRGVANEGPWSWS